MRQKRGRKNVVYFAANETSGNRYAAMRIKSCRFSDLQDGRTVTSMNSVKKICPDGFLFQLDAEEFANWKSNILTSNLSDEERASIMMGVRRPPVAFTGRGLYMLATILKGEIATLATLAIVNTYAQLRSVVRDMEALQALKDGSPEQAAQLTRTGHKLAALIGDNLSTESTKTTIELNLAVLKITHEVTRTKKRK